MRAARRPARPTEPTERGTGSGRRRAAIAAAALVAALGCTQANAGRDAGLASSEAQQAYSLGHAIGRQVLSNLGDADPAALARGFSDAVEARAAALEDGEMEHALQALETRRADEARQAFAALAAANAEAGDAYRIEFAAQPGVTALENGLLYKVLEAGTGDPPAPGSEVTVHYRSQLVDGTLLDESYSRGEPITIALESALPGWTAALERMPEGAKWQVVVPPSLAYGETGARGFIEPNTTLVFELERVAS